MQFDQTSMCLCRIHKRARLSLGCSPMQFDLSMCLCRIHKRVRFSLDCSLPMQFDQISMCLCRIHMPARLSLGCLLPMHFDQTSMCLCRIHMRGRLSPLCSLPMQLGQKLMCLCTIRIYNDCEGRIKKSVPRIIVWHHEACRVMTNGDPEVRIFLSYPHTNNGFFFMLTTLLFIYLF